MKRVRIGSRARTGRLRSVALAGVTLTLIGASAACASSGSSGESSGAISIGTSTSLTGSLASTCKPVNSGATAWFKYVNAHGGVNGRKINDIVQDDAGNPSQAIGNAKQFISDHVSAVVGGCGSSTSTALESYLNGNKMPYLFPYASLTMSPTPNYVFALFPEYAAQMSAMIPQAMKQYGKGGVYGMVVTIPEASSISSAISQATSAAGGTAQLETMPVGPPSVSPYVLKYAASKANYLVLVLAADDAARVVQQLASQNELPQHVLAFSGLASEVYFQNIPAAADAANEVASPVAPPGSAGAKQCEAAFAAAHVSTTTNALDGCAQAQAAVATFKKAGKDLSASNLVSTLQSMNSANVGSVVPPLSFSPSNHVGEQTVFLCTVSNGKLVYKSTLSLPVAG